MSIPNSLVMKKGKRNTAGSVFSANLKTILKDRGLTAKAAAAIAEISPSTFGQWVNGATPLDMEAVFRFARGVNVDFAWLLTGKSEPSKTPSISDLFETSDVPDMSGIFLIEAKRLKVKQPK